MSQPDDLVDASVLDELLASVDGDRAFVTDLVQAYLADGQAHVEAVRQAIADQDAEALVRPAHTLKSSSATVGAMPLSALARELETMGRGGSVDPGADGAADRLEDLWTRSADALRGWLAASS